MRVCLAANKRWRARIGASAKPVVVDEQAHGCFVREGWFLVCVVDLESSSLVCVVEFGVEFFASSKSGAWCCGGGSRVPSLDCWRWVEGEMYGTFGGIYGRGG